MLLPLERALVFFERLRGNWGGNRGQRPSSSGARRDSDNLARKRALTPISADGDEVDEKRGLTPVSEKRGLTPVSDGGRKRALTPISVTPISPTPISAATELVLDEILTRLGYLNEVGLGYLTLDRQSRTLSGGEVQRINLTTALGTSLVNTLFVLDEPSIGLHARDMRRVVGVLEKLRDAGNTLLVVEHDGDVMRAA